MDLQNHGALEAFALQSVVNANHGQLHNVGGRALDRGIDGVSLGMPANRLVPRIDVAQVAAATQKRFDIALSAGGRDLVVDVLFDSGVGGEVLLNYLLGLRPRQVGLLA